MNNKAPDLSGGQQQRLAIARSLINEPSIILADEPTGNLDSETTDQVYTLMRDINKALDTAFLIVTHNDHIAAKSDRIISMKDGVIQKDYFTNDLDQDDLWQGVAPQYCRQCPQRRKETHSNLL